MIEVSLQWTCDGCGITEMWHELDASKKTVRAALRAGGWRSRGAQDYCPSCVAHGLFRLRYSSCSQYYDNTKDTPT